MTDNFDDWLKKRLQSAAEDLVPDVPPSLIVTVPIQSRQSGRPHSLGRHLRKWTAPSLAAIAVTATAVLVLVTNTGDHHRPTGGLEEPVHSSTASNYPVSTKQLSMQSSSSVLEPSAVTTGQTTTRLLPLSLEAKQQATKLLAKWSEAQSAGTEPTLIPDYFDAGGSAIPIVSVKRDTNGLSVTAIGPRSDGVCTWKYGITIVGSGGTSLVLLATADQVSTPTNANQGCSAVGYPIVSHLRINQAVKIKTVLDLINGEVIPVG